jgi:hypothetical protein
VVLLCSSSSSWQTALQINDGIIYGNSKACFVIRPILAYGVLSAPKFICETRVCQHCFSAEFVVALEIIMRLHGNACQFDIPVGSRVSRICERAADLCMHAFPLYPPLPLLPIPLLPLLSPLFPCPSLFPSQPLPPFPFHFQRGSGV